MKTPESLHQELLLEFGPYVPLSRVWRQLSFPSLDAARKAVPRGAVPVECIALPGRRGWFVRTTEFAKWFADAMGQHQAAP